MKWLLAVLFSTLCCLVVVIGYLTARVWLSTNPVSMPPQTAVSEDFTANDSNLISPTPQNAVVLGASEEMLMPATLYGLINGWRRDQSSTPFVVNSILETVARRMMEENQVVQEDHQTLAQNLGYTGKSVVVISSQGHKSSWDLFNTLRTDPKNEMLLGSDHFSAIGASIMCNNQDPTPCKLWVVLGGK